jgi:ligand-binding sensor domain-containing protein
MNPGTTDEGLPQNSVNAIAQAPEGFLWIGMLGGLARFDGTSFRLIDRSDGLVRHIDRILSLVVSPDSAVWIGTEEEGLLRYHHGTFELFTATRSCRTTAFSRCMWTGRVSSGWAQSVGGSRGWSMDSSWRPAPEAHLAAKVNIRESRRTVDKGLKCGCAFNN